MAQHALWFLNEGGPIMWLILALSVSGTWIFLERLFLMRSIRNKLSSSEGLLNSLLAPLSSGDLRGAEEALRLQEDGPLKDLLKELVGLWDAGAQAMREGGSVFIRGEVFRQQKGLRWLEMSVRLSPMLGLLGTVIGMVQMFAAIGSSGAASSLVARGIRVALFTTVAGLSCAIPAQAGLIALQHMIDWYEEALNRAADRVVLARFKGPAQAQRPRGGKMEVGSLG
ncbi:MAG: MotA/TolQ/ExbB proton channel family protein [Thermanaerothrix sp.]|nr:MotA/TolQ/ExbB proton channel family protein [Thermanaerothrix sp.]